MPDPRRIFDAVHNWDVKGRFANGVEFRLRPGGDNTIFHGTEGKISIRRGGISAEPKSLLSSKIGPDEIHLTQSGNHRQNFLDCVRSRATPVSDIDDAVKSDTISHLGDIAIRTGRTIRWDPKAETIVGDEEAARMLHRPLRSPWRL
jgi:hypothetical protein